MPERQSSTVTLSRSRVPTKTKILLPASSEKSLNSYGGGDAGANETESRRGTEDQFSQTVVNDDKIGASINTGIGVGTDAGTGTDTDMRTRGSESEIIDSTTPSRDNRSVSTLSSDGRSACENTFGLPQPLTFCFT